MYLVNCPAELHDSLTRAFGGAVQRSEILASDVFHLKFVGYPWYPTGMETVRTRQLILTLMETLEQYGFSLYAAIDQDNGREGRGMDTWHCNRRLDWAAGVPVYHG